MCALVTWEPVAALSDTQQPWVWLLQAFYTNEGIEWSMVDFQDNQARPPPPRC